MSKTRGDYGSDVTRPKINTDTHFELKRQFLKELRDNTFSGSEHEDANEHIEKVLEIEVILFYNGLDVPTRQILDLKGVVPSMTVRNAKVSITSVVSSPRKYSELTPADAIQADCDAKATNIILQGLPPEVYALVSNHRIA
ncbi:hypothetical protein Tco_0373728 [Tanacetum coccineum]